MREWIAYDPATGILTWVKSPKWGIRPGDRAGMVKSTGYRTVGFKGKLYLAHHIAWLFMTGSWPTDEVDHDNGDRDGNWWDNLRSASSVQNAHNRRSAANASSGYKGVSWHKLRGKFQAQIQVSGKKKCLGYFVDPAEAHAAYCRAAIQHFGEYANGG